MSMKAGSVTVTIPSTSDDKQGVVFYFVRVVINGGKHFLLSKRFSHFTDLHEQLAAESFGIAIPAPPAKKIKFLVNHSDKEFIEQRRVLLEQFMQKVVENENGRMLNSTTMKTFLENDIVTADVGIDQDAKVAEYVSEEVSEVSIRSVKQMSDHTLFQIYCANGDKEHRGDMNEWVSLKRYQDFAELDAELRNTFAGNAVLLSLLPVLPPKGNRILVDHTDSKFIEERRLLLENYLKRVIRVREAVNHKSVLRFLNADFS